MEPKDLAALEANPSNETHPATFIANGTNYPNVRIRFRGQWARTWPKKPLKIFFEDAKPFEGQGTINLNSGWRDPAFVRETLAYEVYAACGVPAPRSRMVRVEMNGEFRGLYVEVEQPEKEFLKRIKYKGAVIYKAASQNNQADERDLGKPETFAGHYSLETQKDTGFVELQQFCHELNTTTNALGFFKQKVDVEKYGNYLAAATLLQNWDCFSKNHFLLFDAKKSKKWFPIPWDLDRTLGDHWHGGFSFFQLPILLGTQPLPGPTGWNRMQAKFFSVPELRDQYFKRLEKLLATEFTEEKLFPILDRYEIEIASDAVQDRQRWPNSNVSLHRSIEEVKRYIRQRREFLQSELKTLQKAG